MSRVGSPPRAASTPELPRLHHLCVAVSGGESAPQDGPEPVERASDEMAGSSQILDADA